jgi:hypothetical protein
LATSGNAHGLSGGEALVSIRVEVDEAARGGGFAISLRARMKIEPVFGALLFDEVAEHVDEPAA